VQGRFWLLAGFANPDSELFTEELRTIQAANPGEQRGDGGCFEVVAACGRC